MSRFEGVSNLTPEFYLNSMPVVNQEQVDLRDAQLVRQLDVSLTQSDTFSWTELASRTNIKWDKSKEYVTKEVTVSATPEQKARTVGTVIFNLRQGIKGREVRLQIGEQSKNAGLGVAPYRAIQKQVHPGQNR